MAGDIYFRERGEDKKDPVEETPELNLGLMRIKKGEIRSGTPFFAWDAVQDCEGGQCPVHHQCSYPKEGKCSVHVDYMKTLIYSITRSYTYLDEHSLYKIGVQILPLYSQLLRMKLIEMGLPGNEIVVVSDKGSMSIHPIFKEIRETIKTINSMWKDIGINPFGPGALNPKMKPGEGDKNMKEGNPSYHRSLQTTVDRKGVIR